MDSTKRSAPMLLQSCSLGDDASTKRGCRLRGAPCLIFSRQDASCTKLALLKKIVKLSAPSTLTSNFNWQSLSFPTKNGDLALASTSIFITHPAPQTSTAKSYTPYSGEFN